MDLLACCAILYCSRSTRFQSSKATCIHKLTEGGAGKGSRMKALNDTTYDTPVFFLHHSGPSLGKNPWVLQEWIDDHYSPG